MSEIRNYLFHVQRTSNSIQSQYGDNLGWFFDDQPNNPLTFPQGMIHVIAGDETKQLEIAFLSDKISLTEITNYLQTIGIDAQPLEEYKPPTSHLLVKIALYPFIFVIGNAILLFVRIYQFFKRRK